VLLPTVIAAYRDEHTDPALFARMGELGLLGVTLPQEYGCAGASYVAYGLVAREVERVDSGPPRCFVWVVTTAPCLSQPRRPVGSVSWFG